MKTLFMGTPDFALPCLETLCRKTQVCGVVTQPDKPKGRGYTLTPPPVKVLAESKGIPVFQPATLRDGTFLPVLQELAPDLIVVVAYGKILPKEILELPRYGCINVHASLLPQYRGAAPIQWAIVRGETESGVTTMQMDEGLDTGDMLVRRAIPILPTDTGGSLHDKLSGLGASVLEETLQQLEDGSLKRTPQTGESSYAPLLDRQVRCICWEKTAQEICDQVRGFYPFPKAFTCWEDKRLQILEAAVAPDLSLRCGEVGTCDETLGLPVGCGDGAVWIRSIQAEGKRAMSVQDYLRGNELPAGIVLG